MRRAHPPISIKLPQAYDTSSFSTRCIMANQATGSNGAADGHQQSIGAEDAQAIDGIAGSPAGTQQPSGADVDAGGAGAGPGQRHEEPVPSHPLDKGVLRPSDVPSGGISGMSGQGVAQPRGAAGVFGSHAQGRIAQFALRRTRCTRATGLARLFAAAKRSPCRRASAQLAVNTHLVSNTLGLFLAGQGDLTHHRGYVGRRVRWCDVACERRVRREQAGFVQ